MAHDGQGMALKAMPCATSATDCTTFDDIKNDDRRPELKVFDAPSDYPTVIIPAAEFVADDQINRLAQTYLPTGSPPVSTTSLNIRYCVYLI
jgi:hypothetical protein